MNENKPREVLHYVERHFTIHNEIIENKTRRPQNLTAHQNGDCVTYPLWENHLQPNNKLHVYRNNKNVIHINIVVRFILLPPSRKGSGLLEVVAEQIVR